MAATLTVGKFLTQRRSDATTMMDLRIPSHAFGAPTAHTHRMIRIAFVMFALLLPVGLVYAAGAWSLLVGVALVGCLFLFSSRQASGTEITQGGRLTGYSSSEFHEL